jgi:hypothetical protein
VGKNITYSRESIPYCGISAECVEKRVEEPIDMI